MPLKYYFRKKKKEIYSTLLQEETKYFNKSVIINTFQFVK